MKIYKDTTIKGIEDFYGDLLFQITEFKTIKSHLAAMADKMWEGVSAKNRFVFHEISNYHPVYSGRSVHELKKIALTSEDCNTTIACEYGFNSWSHLEEQLADTTYDPEFELTVNTLLEGDLEALKLQIQNNPDLVKKRSRYGHGACLLHYTASNGVEIWRQKVPAKLPQITTYLLQAGADVNTTMRVYGSMYDTLDLLATSAHPFDAGVGLEMMEILKHA